MNESQRDAVRELVHWELDEDNPLKPVEDGIRKELITRILTE